MSVLARWTPLMHPDPLWSLRSVALLLWLKPFPCPPNRFVVRITQRAWETESSPLSGWHQLYEWSLDLSGCSTDLSSSFALGRFFPACQQRPLVATKKNVQIYTFSCFFFKGSKRRRGHKSIVFLLYHFKNLTSGTLQNEFTAEKQQNTRQISGNFAEGSQEKTKPNGLESDIKDIRLCNKHNLPLTAKF